VSILGNEFASSTPPKQGAWIVAHDARALRTSDNKHPSEVPLMKTDAQSR